MDRKSPQNLFQMIQKLFKATFDSTKIDWKTFSCQLTKKQALERSLGFMSWVNVAEKEFKTVFNFGT